MINKAQQQLENQPVTRILALEKAVRDIKARQLFGQDNIPIKRSAFTTYSHSLAPGEVRNLQLLFTYVDRNDFYLSEVGIVWYVDTYGDPGHIWPRGASLTSTQVGDFWPGTAYYDPAASSEPGNGLKAYNIPHENRGATTRTIYADIYMLYIQQGQ